MSTIFDSIGIDPGIVIIVLLIVVLVLIGTTISSKSRNLVRGGYKYFLDRIFVRKFAQIDHLYETKEEHEQAIRTLAKHFKLLYSKYGVEKYDAFDDVGGKLSFALALLDRENTGVILNAVHSRDNCFLYLKEIVKGESYVMLSQEEVEALRKAVNFGLGEVNEKKKEK